MKKCRKYLSFIYKELDGVIKDKEKEELTYHIEHCDKCREEYLIIKNIKEELTNSGENELPENFKSALHTKLVEYNLKREDKIPFYKRIPVNLTATVCVAAAIAIFAINNIPDITSIKDDAAEIVKNEVREDVYVTADDAEIINTEPEIKKSVPETKVVEAPEIAPDVAPAIETEHQTAAFSLRRSIPSENNFITIKVKEETDIKSLLPYAEENEDNTFKASMTQLEDAKTLLKDYIVSIENETDETKEKEIFIITR